MSENSLPTQLIPARQRARRSGNGGGSVACWAQGHGSGAIRSEPMVRVSHIRLKVYFLEDEIQRGVTASWCHTMAKVALHFVSERMLDSLISESKWRVPSEGIDGIESRPKYGATQISVNTGSLLLVNSNDLRGDGTLILLNGRPVMGTAAGVQSTRRTESGYKFSAMKTNASSLGGRRVVYVFGQSAEKEDC